MRLKIFHRKFEASQIFVHLRVWESCLMIWTFVTSEVRLKCSKSYKSNCYDFITQQSRIGTPTDYFHNCLFHFISWNNSRRYLSKPKCSSRTQIILSQATGQIIWVFVCCEQTYFFCDSLIRKTLCSTRSTGLPEVNTKIIYKIFTKFLQGILQPH